MQPNLNITYYGPKVSVIILFQIWFPVDLLLVFYQCYECQFLIKLELLEVEGISQSQRLCNSINI
jgi:hypothetical protein